MSSLPNTRSYCSALLGDPISSIEETVAVHAKLIARFGGSGGIRDRAALESALARPRSGYYSDVIQEAVALWESLSQNHPFLDGNKRAAVTMAAALSARQRIQPGIH